MTREKKLIRQIEYGDRTALGELIEMYYEDIFRYCQWHTTERACAEDAVQETFLKAVRYLDANHFRGEFRPFLYKIARNTCIDLSRKRYRDDVYLDNLEQEPGYAETGFGQAEEDTWLHQVVHKLEPDIQEIILLRFGQELSLKEIAAVTGFPMRTVQSKLRATLKQLKTELSESDEIRKDTAKDYVQKSMKESTERKVGEAEEGGQVKCKRQNRCCGHIFEGRE